MVIDLGGTTTTVRLEGVNATEVGECFSDEATRFLTQAVAGREVRVEARGDDQFGRTLAYVWHEDTLVNHEIVAMGLAIATTPEADEPYGALLLEAEREAVGLGLGLWGAAACGERVQRPALAIEVSPNPDGPDEDHLDAETVTVFNLTSDSIDITGWVIRDESSVHRYVFGERLLEPDGNIVVTSDDEGWGRDPQPIWNNGGDTAILLDPQGTVMARIRY